MKFDREAPGEGAEAICKLENGKAVLEWRFYFVEETEGGSEGMSGRNDRRGGESSWLIRIMLTDMQGNMVLEGIQPLHEEEPLRSVLVQPHLWSGARDPYLYRLEAVLTDGSGRCLDHISRPLPLRSFSCAGEAERFFLNGEAFERRAVVYDPPCASSEAERVLRIQEDLRRIRRLGANCVLAEGGDGPGRSFLYLCDRMGLLFFCREKRKAGYADFADGKTRYAGFAGEAAGIRISPGERAPVFRGEKDCLFVKGSDLPTSLFYRYLAKWSREPFVYIEPQSVRRMKSGNYAVRCYSNCERIALYSDGTLFEFQRGEEEFAFSEVPARTPCIMLTAEGDGCSASLSLSKTVCPFREWQE